MNTFKKLAAAFGAIASIATGLWMVIEQGNPVGAIFLVLAFAFVIVMILEPWDGRFDREL